MASTLDLGERMSFEASITIVSRDPRKMAQLLTYVADLGLEISETRSSSAAPAKPVQTPTPGPKPKNADAPAPAEPAKNTAEIDPNDPELDKFTKWHATQVNKANGKGKFYSKSQSAKYLPAWTAAQKAYVEAGGPLNGQSTKNWTIKRFRSETEALSSSSDQEGSPSPSINPAKKKAQKGSNKPGKKATKKLRSGEVGRRSKLK